MGEFVCCSASGPNTFESAATCSAAISTPDGTDLADARAVFSTAAIITVDCSRGDGTKEASSGHELCSIRFWHHPRPVFYRIVACGNIRIEHVQSSDAALCTARGAA